MSVSMGKQTCASQSTNSVVVNGEISPEFYEAQQMTSIMLHAEMA